MVEDVFQPFDFREVLMFPNKPRGKFFQSFTSYVCVEVLASPRLFNEYYAKTFSSMMTIKII